MRYASIANRSWLAWRGDGDEATTQVLARVWDISQSGASVVVAEPPPLQPGNSAWIRMESPAPSEWVEVKVVGGAAITRSRFLLRARVIGYLIRLKFVAACPYDIFKSATHGHQLDAAFEQTGPRDEDCVIWR